MNEPQYIATDSIPTIHDCWNKVGVRGDKSCTDLLTHIHCRNCSAYSAAAATLLNRRLADAYVSEWSSQFAEEQSAPELNIQSAFIFRIGVEWLALPTKVFAEVAEIRKIHSLPHQHSKVILGVTNVRGELLICVALGALLGLEKLSSPSSQRGRAIHKRFMVIQDNGQRLVLPVDEIYGVHRYQLKELTEVPATVGSATITYTKAMLTWSERVVGCLDEQLIFYALNRSLS